MKKKQPYRIFPVEVTEQYLPDTSAELRKQAPDCPARTFADVGRYAVIFAAERFGSWFEMERYANRARRVLDLLEELESLRIRNRCAEL
jgi:hypothetical protein